MKLTAKEAQYDSEVVTRFELYNSLFLTLPFYQVKHTGTLLPFFATHIEKSIAEQLPPTEIIESFFKQYGQYVQSSEHIDLLFRIIQYIERQVVLFDAVEDAAFLKTGRGDNAHILNDFLKRLEHDHKLKKEVVAKLNHFSLRLVLTAHPTQFYPGEVLMIINDLMEAIRENDINSVHLLLQQLGKTPFLRLSKPSPVDEARSLAWFLENVFYYAATNVQFAIDETINTSPEKEKSIVELGFWPGGDRDGNPNVGVESTKEISSLLRTILFRCYYRDFRILKRRITFKGVEKYMDVLQEALYQNSFNSPENPKNVKALLIDNLEEIKRVVAQYHDGLFLDLVDDLIRKINLFGVYFASLDIRQDSGVLRKTFGYLVEKYPAETGLPENYTALSEEEKIKLIAFTEQDLIVDEEADPLIKDTLDTIRYVKKMQEAGGEYAVHRFIISNSQHASDILELRQLFLWCGWKVNELFIDFVPLFETVDDLHHAADVMNTLYRHEAYKKHLNSRNTAQTIMLGFSDSTKDGGYLMANWSIYKAKIELTAISREYEVDLTFFDGRGGPPARGGGKTHNFYASMGEEIANDHIQLTIQGQTISSQYGSFESARYNIQQLLHAGLASDVERKAGDTLGEDKKMLIDQMAEASYKKFKELREDPLFLPYLEEMSPLKFLSDINISSRPIKRNTDAKLQLKDLRAISFVTAWSQLKQNIPGFFGVGTALKAVDEAGKWKETKILYDSSGMFKTIIDNCIMAMTKSNFAITAYLEHDAVFGAFYKMLKAEFDLAKSYILKLTETNALMENYPVEKQSIAIREKIITPLVIIQHYAIKSLRGLDVNDPKYSVFSKLLTRTVYGIVNAGRNLV